MLQGFARFHLEFMASSDKKAFHVVLKVLDVRLGTWCGGFVIVALALGFSGGSPVLVVWVRDA